MKMRTLFLGFTVLLLVSTGVGQQEMINPEPGPEPQPPEPVQPASPSLNLTLLQEQYNQRSDQIPPYVGSIIGDQTITVNLSEVNGSEKILKEEIIGVRTNGVRTEEVQWGEFEEPTLKIWITQENLERLGSSDEPSKELKAMMKNDDIKYQTYTIGNSIKMGLVKFFLSF